MIGEVIQLDKMHSMGLSKEKIFKKWYLIWDWKEGRDFSRVRWARWNADLFG